MQAQAVWSSLRWNTNVSAASITSQPRACRKSNGYATKDKAALTNVIGKKNTPIGEGQERKKLKAKIDGSGKGGETFRFWGLRDQHKQGTEVRKNGTCFRNCSRKTREDSCGKVRNIIGKVP